MRAFLYFLLVAGLAGRKSSGWTFDRPCADGPCPTDAMTLHWTIDVDENIDLFALRIATSASAEPTYTDFNPIGMDSSTVLPASFLPAVRPGQTSGIIVSLGTTEYRGVNEPFVWKTYSDVSLFAPGPTTVTVTSTTQTPSFVTVTATPTDADREEDFPIDNGNGDSGGLSSGAKAGIGVGVSAAVLLLAAGGFWVYKHRQRGMDDHDAVPVIRVPELDPGGMGGEKPLSELEGKSVVYPSITTTIVGRDQGADARYEMGG
ncbi:hypothetical protein BDV11DRAFT_192746 [Aspergillus similis]